MNDPNLLVLFGAILGLIGSALLSIDALGAPDFLAALEDERARGIRMAGLGFTALINRIFLYLFVTVVGFLTILVISGRLVPSLILAPVVYFLWRWIGGLTLLIERKLRRLGPSSARTYRRSKTIWGIFLNVAHVLLWIPPYLAVAVIALAINYLVTVPLYFMSEKATVPLVARLYRLTALVVAEEKRWHLKANALIGSIFILFGFLYQFVAALMVIDWRK